MMGDDGAGALLAQRLKQEPLENWQVLDGGSAPENVLYQVREMAPERVLLVDAADMDLTPGSIRYVMEERLTDPFLFTTHTLPLTFLIEALHEFVPQVEFLGIQPDVVAFGFPMSPSVRNAVEQVYLSLKSGEGGWDCL
jgi:hydrogenase 3 maturation protease